jgi:transposase-like protein
VERPVVAISNNPVFQDAEAAREFLESLLWPDGPACPHCGLIGCSNQLHGKGGPKGTKHRPGVYKCKGCEKQFTVTVGTLFERSHIPLNKWLLILHLMVCSKKGISAHQIHRMLGLTYKSAWFACHRIREAMRDGRLGPLGGENKVVEADETYIGGKAANRKNHIPPKEVAFALLERDGAVRSFHVPKVDAKTLGPVLHAHIDRRSYLMTDEAPVYLPIGREFSGHGAVNHSIEEYVRGNFWHTNTVESYFSILKRGITGTYHHISQQHLKRYLGEFDFRYNERVSVGVNDDQRMAKAAKGIVGKRLTYRRTRRQDEFDTPPF